MIKKLEKQIIGKMGAIKRGEVSIEDSKIGILINRMQTLDEHLFVMYLNKYRLMEGVINSTKK